MQAIDLDKKLEKYFLDDDRKIPDAHLNSVCLIHRQEKTCKYVFWSSKLYDKGPICTKKTSIKISMDKYAENGKMTAQGDNCEGLGSLK